MKKLMCILGLCLLAGSAIAGPVQWAVLDGDGYVRRTGWYPSGGLHGQAVDTNKMEATLMTDIPRSKKVTMVAKNGASLASKLVGTNFVDTLYVKTKDADLLALEDELSGAIDDFNLKFGKSLANKPFPGLKKEIRKGVKEQAKGGTLTPNRRETITALEDLEELVNDEYKLLRKPEWIYGVDANGQTTVVFGEQVVNP